MRRDVWLKRLLAGLFFVLSLALLTGSVFVLGVEKGFTEPKFEMTALFHMVGGLGTGAPVRLSGVTVGTVKKIDFLEDEVEGRGVEVTLNLYSKYQKQLRKSVNVAIITEGVLGEKIVEITSEPGFYVSDLDRPFIGEDPLDVQTLAETFGEAAASLLETSKEIQSVTREVKSISSTTRRLLNRIEQHIIDGDLFKLF